MVGVIYKIINKENGKFYLGSTHNFQERVERHFNDLENGNHHNLILQRAWDKYGKEVFEIKRVETVEENLRKREQEFLDEFSPLAENRDVYNISSCSSGGDLLSQHPNKEEIEKRKSERFREYIKSLSEEERKKKWGRNGKSNPNWKGGIYEEKTTCNCGNDKNYRAEKCRECYDKSGKNNPFYGKSHTEEAKKKMSETQKGSYNGDQNKPIIGGEKKYSSLGEAARKLDVNINTISYRLNNDTFPNWQYLEN